MMRSSRRQLANRWNSLAAPLLVLICTAGTAPADVQVRLGTQHSLNAFTDSPVPPGSDPEACCCDDAQEITLGGTHVAECSRGGAVARMSAFIGSESDDRGLRSLRVFSDGTASGDFSPGNEDAEILMSLSLVLEVTDAPVAFETTLAATGFDPDVDFFGAISDSALFGSLTFPIDPASPFAAIGTLAVGTHNIEIVIAKTLDVGTPPTMTWDLNIAFGRTREMHWINPAGGLFGEPSNWEPNQAPSTEEHIAIIDLGGAVPIDFVLSDVTAGQLLVRNTTVDLFGGRLFLRAPTIEDPSLGIGSLAQLVLQAGQITCNHAVVGDLADDPTAVAALELLGDFSHTPLLEASGTVLIGASQTSRLSVTDAKLQCRTLQLAGAGTGSTAEFRGPQTDVSVNNLDMGIVGPANLTISDGAAVLTDVVELGIGPLGVSSLTVDGFNAQRNRPSTLTANALQVAGDFGIRAGGQVDVERLTVGTDDPLVTSVLTVTGQTQSTFSRLTVESLVSVLGALVQVTVSEKAQVNFLGGAEIRPVGVGVFEVIGPDSACTVVGTLTVASGGVAGIDVSEGGVFSRAAGEVATLLVGEGENRGSIVIVHPIERFNDPVPSQMRFNDIDIVKGSVVVRGAGRLAGDHTITVRDRLEVDSNLLNSQNVVCGQLNIKANGVVRCCPSGHLVATTIVNEVGGRIEGDANVTGNVVTSGLVRVGCSPGTLSVFGNHEQTEAGVLEIEVAGLDAGQFDVLKVTGNATLAGRVDLKFIDGFVPQPGDKVDFVQVSGTVEGILKGGTIEVPADETAGTPGLTVEANWEVTPEGTCRMTVTNVTAADQSALNAPGIPGCGAGLCGAGVVPMLPLTLAGMGFMKVGRWRPRRASR